jgi:hypothetical protein
MSKRLQVVLDDEEFAEFQRAAVDDGETLSGWVRRALREVRRQESRRDLDRRLSAVREATTHSFPVGDIDEMLAEIEQGYSGR